MSDNDIRLAFIVGEKIMLYESNNLMHIQWSKLYAILK